MKYSIIVFPSGGKFYNEEGENPVYPGPFIHIEWPTGELSLPIMEALTKEELRQQLNKFVDGLDG